MSYALDVKEELTRYKASKEEDLVSLNAMLRNGFELSFFGNNNFGLTFQSKSNPIIRYVIKLLLNSKSDIKYELYQKQVMRFDKPQLFVLRVREDCNYLVTKFNLLKDGEEEKANILNHEELIKAFLRGAFVCCGSVNDPKTSNYHLEFRIPGNKEAIYIQTLINSFNLNARISRHKEKYIVYLKDKDSICDLLRIMGVSTQAFIMEQDIIMRGLVADTKRKMNFEIANQSKTNEASKQMLRYIKYLETYYPLDKLDNKIKIIMKVRKENPEASLIELCEILQEEYGEKITKSGLNHRLRKIKELAIDYRNKRNE